LSPHSPIEYGETHNMPLNLPTNADVVNYIRSDIKSLLPDADPYEVTSILNAIAVATGGRVYEIYQQLYIIQRDTYATTAENQALLNIGAVYALSRNPATAADGYITLTGTASTVIPSSTEFQSSTGESYQTKSSVTLASNSINISSVTRSGTTATATTASAHNLASGMSVVIAGADQTDYNGTFDITVTSLTEFQYSVSGSPATPATGTITAAYTGASVEVQSVNTGLDTNVTGGSTLTATSAISGLDSTAYVQYGGIDGGTDIETYDDFRTRLLQRIQNPVTPFNETNIILQARQVAGVTRVWVYEPDDINDSVTPSSIDAIASDYAKVTFSADHDLLDGMRITVSGANESAFNGTFRVLVVSTTEVVYYSSGVTGSASGTITVAYSNVQLGQTRIFFVRDNDPSIIPTSGEVSDVETKILEIKPANTSDNDVIVAAPVANTIDFTFTALSPDTSGIRSSIEANLNELFDELDIGDDITQVKYQTAIQNAFDSETGQGVDSFTLSAPSGSITNEYNEIAILGTVSY